MPLKTHLDEVPTLNLTSMIDVLFLLIIFFMVATKFDESERSIDVSVPEVAHAGETNTPPKPVVVSVFADGHVALDGQDLSVDELVEQLAVIRRLGDPAVIIRGDENCPFRYVAAALAACRQANISELGITVRMAGVGQPTSMK